MLCWLYLVIVPEVRFTLIIIVSKTILKQLQYYRYNQACVKANEDKDTLKLYDCKIVSIDVRNEYELQHQLN